MKIDDKISKSYKMILTEKQKISALLSGKIDKYEYLTSKKYQQNKLTLLMLF